MKPVPISQIVEADFTWFEGELVPRLQVEILDDGTIGLRRSVAGKAGNGRAARGPGALPGYGERAFPRVSARTAWKGRDPYGRHRHVLELAGRDVPARRGARPGAIPALNGARVSRDARSGDHHGGRVPLPPSPGRKPWLRARIKPSSKRRGRRGFASSFSMSVT